MAKFEITDALTEKAKKAKNIEELMALAKEHDIQLTEEGAKKIFVSLHGSMELGDEELDNVAGGHNATDCNCKSGDRCVCGSTNTVYIAVRRVYHCNGCGLDYGYWEY